jgi:hypothetical protein
VSAIAVTGEIEAPARRLKEYDSRRRRLLDELTALDRVDWLSTLDMTAVERDLRKPLTEWRGLLRRQTPIARQMLGKLLDGRITWTAHRDEGRYEFAGRAKLDRLLTGVVFTRNW